MLKNVVALIVSSSIAAVLVQAEVPVSVMLPLDLVSSSGEITDRDQLSNYLSQLKSGNVAGVMADCWWGLVESVEQKYDFSAYSDLVQMTADAGLTIEFVMSFHQCGGNVGDDCNIPLPQWVLDSGDDIFYQDQDGNIDFEYISLFADNAAVIGTAKRTPLQVYEDFMSAFNAEMSSFIGSTIVEIEVGAGPCGELRYPAYQLDKWSFCGIGAFQSYSSYAVNSLTAAALKAGHADFAVSPSNAGSYNSKPYETAFFSSSSSSDNYKSDYGKFFLGWYTNALVTHGDDVLTAARNVFGNSIRISLKVAGIHWWYFDDSHAAELTSGYWNVNGEGDAYGDIAKMVASHNATFDFTCLEMQDSEQSSECKCGPYELVQQTKTSAATYGAGYAGENALQRYDQTAYDTIKSQAKGAEAFTYLRLTSDLMSGENWNLFTNFVNDMKSV